MPSLPKVAGRARINQAAEANARMGEVVVRLPVRAGEEALLFGSYLSRFLETCEPNPAEAADGGDAPFLMLHSDPLADGEIKVITFQEGRAARAFSQGWARACTGLPGKA